MREGEGGDERESEREEGREGEILRVKRNGGMRKRVCVGGIKE